MDFRLPDDFGPMNWYWGSAMPQFHPRPSVWEFTIRQDTRRDTWVNRSATDNKED